MQMEKYTENRNISRYRWRVRRQGKKRFVSFVCLLALSVVFVAYGNDMFSAQDIHPKFASPLFEDEITFYGMLDDTVEADEDEAAWNLILVNKWNSLPVDYNVALKQIDGQTVDARIYSALHDMLDAAREDEVYSIVASGYRTAEKQQRLLDEKIAAFETMGYPYAEAQKEAETWVAVPGTSEHQLGIAVDINADGIHSYGKEVYAWLKENSYRFGFVLRYPPDKTELTGVSHEPWHYRYVGVQAASEMVNQNLCLEEYLAAKKGTDDVPVK